MNLKVKFSEEVSVLDSKFVEDTSIIEADFSSVLEVGFNADLPAYEGIYRVVPSTSKEQILPTALTYLEDDIKVTKIPYAEVSNNSKGKTVTIGETMPEEDDNENVSSSIVVTDDGQGNVTVIGLKATDKNGHVTIESEV